jgi:hypothetical protein
MFTDVSGQRIGPVFKGQEIQEKIPFLLGLLDLFFLDFLTLEDGPICCPETSVNNYHTTPRNIAEERKSNQHRGGSLKSRLL